MIYILYSFFITTPIQLLFIFYYKGRIIENKLKLNKI